MKRILILFLAAMLMLVSGCAPDSRPTGGESSGSTAEISPSEEAKLPDAAESLPEKENTASSQPNEPTAGNDPTKDEGSGPSTETAPNPGVSSETETRPAEPESKPPSPTIPAVPPEEKPEPPSSEPAPPREPNAGKEDARAVAELVVKYINRLREEQGSAAATRLPGLTAYAEYRSRQIVTNFAHDTLDERAAATALKYGEYVDPSLYGMTGEPYYTANARDALAMAGYAGTVDTVARQLAMQFKNSAGHWAYVGSDEYTYIAAGVTYDRGRWYCAVTVTSVNTDELT